MSVNGEMFLVIIGHEIGKQFQFDDVRVIPWRVFIHQRQELIYSCHPAQSYRSLFSIIVISFTYNVLYNSYPKAIYP